jgi:hypothetical protein
LSGRRVIFLPKKAKGRAGAMRMEEVAWSIRQGRRGMYREKVTIRFPFEVVRELERRARERGLSLSDLVRLYIERGLEEGKQAKS